MLLNFERFEKRILEAFASNVPAISSILTRQFNGIVACERVFEGLGPYSTFTLVDDCPVFAADIIPGPLNLWLENVSFLRFGASATLFFANGKIDMLDVATFDEDWPKGILPVAFDIRWTE